MTLSNPVSGNAPGLSADPLPDLFAQRAQREREWLALKEGTPAARAAWDAFSAAEAAMAAAVASTPEGVAAQIEYIKASYGDPLVTPDPERPATAGGVPVAFLNVILEGLRRIGQ